MFDINDTSRSTRNGRESRGGSSNGVIDENVILKVSIFSVEMKV